MGALLIDLSALALHFLGQISNNLWLCSVLNIDLLIFQLHLQLFTDPKELKQYLTNH
jgi:hypothetical protein